MATGPATYFQHDPSDVREDDRPMTTTTTTRPPAFWPGGPGSRPDPGVRGDTWPACRSAWQPSEPIELDESGLPPVDLWPMGGLWVADAAEPHPDEHVPAVTGRGRRHPDLRPRHLVLRDPRTRAST